VQVPGRRVAVLMPLLAGCATADTAPPPTRAEFEGMRETLATNSEARLAVEAQCRDDLGRKPVSDREMLGALLDLDPGEVVPAFCARTVAAIARGDVNFADFVALSDGSEDPQLLRRYIRALRLDPSAKAI
jgi:hypothetical protein